MQLNYVIPSEFAAMKCLTYIAFLLPQLRTNRFESFSIDFFFLNPEERPLKSLNHQNKFCERGLVLTWSIQNFQKQVS